MRIEIPLIATMIGSMLFLGAFSIFDELGEPYREYGFLNDSSSAGLQVNNGSESIVQAMDKLQASKETADNITDTFQSLTPSFTSLFPFLKNVWNAGKLLIDSVILPRDVLIAVAQIIGVDTSIIYTLFTILMLVVVITLVIILAGRVI